MAGHHPARPRPGGGPARPHDHRGEDRPAVQRMDRHRDRRRRHRRRSTRATRLRGAQCRPRRLVALRPRTSHPPLRHRPGRARRGRRPPRRPATHHPHRQPFRPAGTRPRGVPDRLHRLAGHHLSHAARLGRHLRPRADHGDGTGHRYVDARGRRPPGTRPRPGRRTGPALGPYGGGHRRGPVLGRDDRHRVRTRSPGGRDRRHPQTLRRLLGSRAARNHAPASLGRAELADVLCRRSRWRCATAAPAR